MTIHVLILEPDEGLLESFRIYFKRTTDFEVRLTARADECVKELQSFSPHVLMMEPALPSGMAQWLLDQIADSDNGFFIPVLVLTRFSRTPFSNHPAVKEFFVKPQSLIKISDTIRQLTVTKG